MKRRWLVCSAMLLSLVMALPASTQTHSVLTNGDFEVDTSGWGEWWSTLTRTTTTVHSGSGAGAVATDWFTWGPGLLTSALTCLVTWRTWPTDGGHTVPDALAVICLGMGCSRVSVFRYRFYNMRTLHCPVMSMGPTSTPDDRRGWHFTQ